MKNFGFPQKIDNMIKNLSVILLIFIWFTLSSCTPFTPETRISPEGLLPETFSQTSNMKRTDRWWESFNDSELNSLIQKALTGNFGIKEAWARLRQARALSVKAGANVYPDLSLNAGTSQTRQRQDNTSGRSVRTIESYNMGLSSTYELDLWGRIRSEREAVRLEETATREDLNTAAISLAASVAENWIHIISQRMQKELLKKQLKTDKTYLELVELRFTKGMVSALDVYQQRQTVEKVSAQIPLIEAREQLLLHELALLLGKSPSSKVNISSETLPLISRIPSAGLPADLLAFRPDVKAAGLRLKASDWQVSTARAERLPAIRLTGSAGFGADKLDILFDNWILSLAGNLTAPIFDGKKRKAEAERAMAKADENFWAYRRSVYTAVKETEDALVNEKKQREHINLLEKEKKAADRALEEAVARYRRGLSDYLPVLTQILSVQSLERDMIKRREELLIYRINLYRALGGAWTGSLVSSN